MRILIAGAALLAGMSSTLVSAEEIVCGEEGQTTYYQDIVGDGCTVIAGSLLVDGEEVTNLDALSSLTTAGVLLISSPNLANLDGLSSLTSAEFLGLRNVPLLENIDGLSNLTSVESLDIQLAPLLTNIDSLSNLTGLGSIRIANTGLTNIDALSNLGSMGAITIQDNPHLSRLDGLSSLTSLQHFLIISGSGITNIDGLSNLTEAGSVTINGTAITDIEGLSGLVKIEEFIPDPESFNNYLAISDNQSLTNLDGLRNLTHVAEGITIRQNDVLADIGGLSALTSVGGLFFIKENNALTNLEGLQNISESTGLIEVSNNNALTSIDGLRNLNTDSRVRIVLNAKLGNCGAVAPLVLSGAQGVLQIGDEAPRCRGGCPNGLGLDPKVEGKLYGGNANTVAGCLYDYVPQTPSERVNDLIETTTQINLANGIANAYDSKLESAFSALEDANTKNDGAAFNKLYAFIHSVEAQRGGKLTDAEADLLIASAMRVIDNLPE
jgi:hypothetical protein